MVAQAMLVWQTCHTIAFVFAIAFQCVPVSAVWTLAPTAKCIDTNGMILAGAALSITEDLVIIALPIPELLKLNLTLRKRISLMLLFALGSLYVAILPSTTLFKMTRKLLTIVV